MEKEPVKFSVRSRVKSFGFAFKGLKVFFRTQHNAWIHALAAGMAILLGFFFHIERWEWCFVITAIGLVFITEAINTAIEFLTDLVSPGFNEKAGRVKDLAAAAVLIASIIALFIGCIIFLPHVSSYF
jgi:diacylglycerol kinase (ATP)